MENKPEKAKMNINYLKSTDVLFEEIWLYLRSSIKSTAITKSVIIEQLILLAAKDLKETGTRSDLYHELTKLKTNN